MRELSQSGSLLQTLAKLARSMQEQLDTLYCEGKLALSAKVKEVSEKEAFARVSVVSKAPGCAPDSGSIVSSAGDVWAEAALPQHGWLSRVLKRVVSSAHGSPSKIGDLPVTALEGAVSQHELALLQVLDKAASEEHSAALIASLLLGPQAGLLKRALAGSSAELTAQLALAVRRSVRRRVLSVVFGRWTCAYSQALLFRS
jgi:hypothetical protein